MKSILISTFLALMVVLSCNEKEASENTDILDENEIFGKWKLESRAVNGISNLAVECCDFIEFSQDAQNDTLNGRFKAFGYQYETRGVFILNQQEQSILFQFGDSQMSYDYTIEESVLSFSYMENGNDISETWRKE